MSNDRTRVVCAQATPGHHPHWRDPVQRLLSKIDISADGCWLYRGVLVRTGYGMISVSGRNRVAHRVAYEHLVGPVPDGMVLDHLCRVRHCVNPDHLEPVHPLENVRRGIKGAITGDPTAIDRIVQMAKDGHSVAQAAQAFGVHTAVISKHLRQNGLPSFRSISAQARRDREDGAA